MLSPSAIAAAAALAELKRRARDSNSNSGEDDEDFSDIRVNRRRCTIPRDLMERARDAYYKTVDVGRGRPVQRTILGTALVIRLKGAQPKLSVEAALEKAKRYVSSRDVPLDVKLGVLALTYSTVRKQVPVLTDGLTWSELCH